MKETVTVLIDPSTNFTIEISKDKATPEYIKELKKKHRKPAIRVRSYQRDPDYYTPKTRTNYGPK